MDLKPEPTPVYVWPPYFDRQGYKLPRGARIVTGSLRVPDDLPSGVLAYMEQEYRAKLWPPCRAEGFSRWAREFAWTNDRRVLHYRIIDVPATKTKE